MSTTIIAKKKLDAKKALFNNLLKDTQEQVGFRFSKNSDTYKKTTKIINNLAKIFDGAIKKEYNMISKYKGSK